MQDNTDSNWGYGPNDNSSTDPTIRQFQSGRHVVLGAGDTVDVAQASGQWLKSDLTVDREVIR